MVFNFCNKFFTSLTVPDGINRRDFDFLDELRFLLFNNFLYYVKFRRQISSPKSCILFLFKIFTSFISSKSKSAKGVID